MERQHVLSVLVANHAGVLTRISNLFSRRCFNIASLSVCETENQELSRMTIVAYGDDYTLEQIMKQLAKLVDVKKIIQLNPEKSLYRELLLLKVRAKPEERSQIVESCNIYGAKPVDLASESLTIELVGDTSKVNSFIELMKAYKILEMARTGLTALERGNKSIYDHDINEIQNDEEEN